MEFLCTSLSSCKFKYLVLYEDVRSRPTFEASESISECSSGSSALSCSSDDVGPKDAFYSASYPQIKAASLLSH